MRDGGIVCFPTESTYGLAAACGNRAAVALLVDLKGRDAARSPIALVAGDVAQAQQVARDWPGAIADLAQRT